jgi:glc operon protein GlcG
MVTQRLVLTLEDADAILAAARAKAVEINVPMALTVLDHAGQTIAFVKMNGSPLMSESAAKGKAYTAVGMGRPTSRWEDAGAASPSFAASITSIPGFTPFGGGLPLLVDGTLVGAVGVSGGSTDDDIKVATAGAQALT